MHPSQILYDVAHVLDGWSQTHTYLLLGIFVKVQEALQQLAVQEAIWRLPGSLRVSEGSVRIELNTAWCLDDISQFSLESEE